MTNNYEWEGYEKELEGIEVASLEWEGIVYVSKGFILGDGVKVKANNANLKRLWNEYIYQEFGTNNINNMIY